MRIETEVRLDFKDVLIRPKRSTLSTRSNVDISRDFQPAVDLLVGAPLSDRTGSLASRRAR